MGKRRTATAKPQKARPGKLTMSLYTPGMSPLHRAGLGGLAATLKYIERAHANKMLEANELPGWPWNDEHPPWEVAPLTITLHFSQPNQAAEYLNRLFAIAFSLKDSVIFLPGQYPDVPPSLPVRVLLQQGITLTFLQHGRVRTLEEKDTVLQYEPEGMPEARIDVCYRRCSGYKHRDGWKDLVDKNGYLKSSLIEVSGPLNPGAVVRHVAFTAKTKIKEDAAHILPLYFALVGCLALPVNRGCGVLLVPEVNHVVRFAEMRPWMTPTTERECQITGTGDAALQAQIRLRANAAIAVSDLPGFHASTFQPRPWAKQQKSRVQTMVVHPGDDSILNQFEVAMDELPPRVKGRSVKGSQGQKGEKREIEEAEWFWTNSVLRCLVADNLAQGRSWYQGFSRLMTAIDPVSKRPIRDRLFFEKEGMHTMVEKISWEDRGESVVVRAVHEAIRRRYGQIASENQGKPVAMKNRWKSEYDRRRLAFAGAKTADQFRRAVCDLFSRAGLNPVLQQEWREVLPMLDASRWQLTRDLALLALASYVGKGAKELEEVTTSEAETTTPDAS